MVAGVHFLPGVVAWRDVGWKALASNISDIAAMGGAPTFALVTLCLPSETPLDDIDELYAGLRDCAESYGVTVAGGDIVVRARLRDHDRALGRRGDVRGEGTPRCCAATRARPGDVIAVTGSARRLGRRPSCADGRRAPARTRRSA